MLFNILLVVWVLVSVVTGTLAARKGYNFILWALAAISGISIGLIGLIILAFLPFANKPEEQQRLKKRGNTIAGVLAAVGIVIWIINVL